MTVIAFAAIHKPVYDEVCDFTLHCLNEGSNDECQHMS